MAINAIFDSDVKQLDHELATRKITCSASALKTEKHKLLLHALMAESIQTLTQTVSSPSMDFKSKLELQFKVAEQIRLAEEAAKAKIRMETGKNKFDLEAKNVQRKLAAEAELQKN